MNKQFQTSLADFYKELEDFHNGKNTPITAFVNELPSCSFCKAQARYDGKTKIGQWANMCEGCFKNWGIGLGTGKGQKLFVYKK